jgi:CO/xanthine dehydrogenase Mo-binding subunit
MLEASYTKPYLSHGSIGPSCAVATFLNNRMIVWTHSQGVFPLRSELVKALKLPAKDIRCMHVEGSGCYGQNGADDVALDAALLARAVPDKPVRVQWMRDDEFGWEPYGAAMSMSAKASLDAEGKIADWHYELWSNTHSMRPESTNGTNVLASQYMAEPQFPGPPKGIPQPAGGGDRNAIPLYDFPNQKVVHHFIPAMPIRVSALRTLGAYANVFALESFMDEMAALAKADPVAFRLAHLKDPRAKAVIEKVAAMSNWKASEAGSLSRGRGIGFAKYKNLATYVAVVTDVEIDRASGKVRVAQAWAAADSGLIINPDGLRNQIEGGILQSTSWTLYEQVRFDKSGIQSRDWASYPIMTMPDVPKVTVELINRTDQPSKGAGEASHGPAVAAIANAVANATGKWLRDLPLDPARVKSAIG